VDVYKLKLRILTVVVDVEVALALESVVNVSSVLEETCLLVFVVIEFARGFGSSITKDGEPM